MNLNGYATLFEAFADDFGPYQLEVLTTVTREIVVMKGALKFSGITSTIVFDPCGANNRGHIFIVCIKYQSYIALQAACLRTMHGVVSEDHVVPVVHVSRVAYGR